MACSRDIDWSPWEVLSRAFLHAAAIGVSDKCLMNKHCKNVNDIQLTKELIV